MRHGGASEFIARLPNGLDTYLERPVRDCYAGLPDGASVFGGKVDNGVLQGIMGTPADNALSGGEMQRIAVARTFMRSASEEHKVGLLLFDEPSASLDPAAEQGMTFPAVKSVCFRNGDGGSFASVSDLFSRLRELRGDKTMIFSTHRFGDLTRHADIIMWVPSFSWAPLIACVILTGRCHRHMKDSVILETGTHEPLMKQEGSDYARLWHIQAKAFL